MPLEVVCILLLQSECGGPSTIFHKVTQNLYCASHNLVLLSAHFTLTPSFDPVLPVIELLLTPVIVILLLPLVCSFIRHLKKAIAKRKKG
jgi:hypothetical protein